MPTTDVIAFLGLIIALSAYVASVRLWMIDRMTRQNDGGKKRTKLILKLLTLADAPLIVSGLLLFTYAFWDHTLKLWLGLTGSAPEWLLSWSIGVFTFALISLMGHHIAAWRKSWGT